jgi:hypothetical protein
MAKELCARKLTMHQKAVLIQVLRTFPNERVEVRYSTATDDARTYAEEFLAIFKAIGWDVEGPQADSSAPAGLTLTASAQTPPCIEALRDALRIYKIETHVRRTDGRDSTHATFTLSVGAREQD